MEQRHINSCDRYHELGHGNIGGADRPPALVTAGLAVETSVDDNAADIAGNSAGIQSNTNAINALPTNDGMQVYSSDGVSIGRLITFKHVGDGTLLIQSDLGYLFESDIIGDGHLMTVGPYYSEPNCAGTAYTFFGMDWAGTTGLVVRSNTDNQAYYWPRGSTMVSVTLVSQLHTDGVCQNGLSWPAVAAAVFPNDEAITGVPNAKPNWPYTLSVP
jgi:hypothetical protein